MKTTIIATVLTFVVAVTSSVLPLVPTLVGSPHLVLAHRPVVAVAAAPEQSVAVHASVAPVAVVGHSVLEYAGPHPHVLTLAAAPAPVTLAVAAHSLPAAVAVVTHPAPTAEPAPIVEPASDPEPEPASEPAAVSLTVEPAKAVLVAPAPVLLSAEGQYLAKTLGSVHSAPLPGHVNSASSINLEPAPGTH